MTSAFVECSRCSVRRPIQPNMAMPLRNPHRGSTVLSSCTPSTQFLIAQTIGYCLSLSHATPPRARLVFEPIVYTLHLSNHLLCLFLPFSAHLQYRQYFVAADTALILGRCNQTQWKMAERNMQVSCTKQSHLKSRESGIFHGSSGGSASGGRREDMKDSYLKYTATTAAGCKHNVPGGTLPVRHIVTDTPLDAARSATVIPVQAQKC